MYNFNMCEKFKNLKNTEYDIALLLNKKGILSANELQEILKVDKATIYRNLKSLIKKNIIRKVSAKKSFYELNCNIHNPIHPHFECIKCNKIYCLKPLSAEDTINISRYTNFEIHSIDIKIKGTCDECKSMDN